MAQSQQPQTYLYRFVESTDSKLEHHLARIAEAGDVPRHVLFKGGRDYVIVVSSPSAGPVGELTVSEFQDLLTRGLQEAVLNLRMAFDPLHLGEQVAAGAAADEAGGRQ